MVVVSHLFSFFDKKLGEGVNRYESHPPSLRTIYFPTAPRLTYLYDRFIVIILCFTVNTFDSLHRIFIFSI